MTRSLFSFVTTPLLAPDDAATERLKDEIALRLGKCSMRLDNLQMLLDNDDPENARLLAEYVVLDLTNLVLAIHRNPTANDLVQAREMLTHLSGAKPTGEFGLLLEDWRASDIVELSRRLEITFRNINTLFRRMRRREFYTAADTWKRNRRIIVAAILILFVVGGHLFESMARRLDLKRRSVLNVELIASQLQDNIRLGGFGDLEFHDGVPYRWGFGPKSLIVFNLPMSRKAEIVFEAVNNHFLEQAIEVVVNGRSLGEPTVLPQKNAFVPDASKTFFFTAKEGLNVIELRYRDWNHHMSLMAPEDSRQFAVIFTRFALKTL